jgi:hypothetical protein
LVKGDPLPARHRVRFYARGLNDGNRPRTSRSLLAQTVLVLPRTMVYDQGIQQQQRVERDDHRDCNGEICPNAHGKHFNETRSFPKTNAITRLLALSSPHKFLLSRASTELGRKSAGEGPPGVDDAAPIRPPTPWLPAAKRDSKNRVTAGNGRDDPRMVGGAPAAVGELPAHPRRQRGRAGTLAKRAVVSSQ